VVHDFVLIFIAYVYLIFTGQEAELFSGQENKELPLRTSEWMQPSLNTKDKFSITDVSYLYFFSFCKLLVTFLSVINVLFFLQSHAYFDLDTSFSMIRMVLFLSTEGYQGFR
jgi:hypothetical protein